MQDTFIPPETLASQRGQSFRALRHRNFRVYLFGLTVSLAGTYMQAVAEGWLVYQLTNSPLGLGLVGFITGIPMAPWSLAVGVLADRVPRKTLLALAQVGQIVPPFILAALTWTGYVQIWHVVLMGVIMGAMSTIDQTTRQALVVDIVAPEDVDNAVALTASSLSAARVVGPALAGVLIAITGVAGAFALNGVSYLAVLIALALMHVPERAKSARQVSFRTSLLEGAKYVVEERSVLGMILLLTAVSTLVLPYQTLLPVLARDILGAGALGLGLLTAVAGIGAVLGAFIAATLPRLADDQRRRFVLFAMLGLAIADGGFAFAGDLALASALLLLVSAGVVAIKTVGFTFVQLHTRDELRGRVMSILLLAMGASPRVGGLAAGYIAGLAGAPFTLGLGSAACFLVGLAALVRFGRSGNRWLAPAWIQERFELGK